MHSTELGAIVDLRKRREEEAQKRLHEARSTEQNAKQLIQTARQRLQAYDNELKARIDSYYRFAQENGVSSTSLTSTQTHHADLTAARKRFVDLEAQAKQTYDAAKREVQKRYKEWSAVYRALESVQELFEEQKATELKRRFKREEDTLSELATLKWKRA